MKKSDLKTGMRVRTRGGTLYLVLKDCETSYYGHQELFFACFTDGFMTGDGYNEHLKHSQEIWHDIMQVYTTTTGRCDACTLDEDDLCLIWKRKEPKRMTVSEIEKALGYRIEIMRED